MVYCLLNMVSIPWPVIQNPPPPDLNILSHSSSSFCAVFQPPCPDTAVPSAQTQAHNYPPSASAYGTLPAGTRMPLFHKSQPQSLSHPTLYNPVSLLAPEHSVREPSLFSLLYTLTVHHSGHVPLFYFVLQRFRLLYHLF